MAKSRQYDLEYPWFGESSRITITIVIVAWLTCQAGINTKQKSRHYPNIDSAIRPVAHYDEVPIPVFTSLPDLIPDELDLKTAENEDRDCSSCSYYSDTSLAIEGHSQENKPRPCTQGQLNDLPSD